MNRGTWLQARRKELQEQNPQTSAAYSQRAVADFVGISAPALSHLERSDAMPSLEVALKLAEYYKKTPQWILTGKDLASEHGIPIIGNTLTGDVEKFINGGLDSLDVQNFVNMPAATDGRLYALKIVQNCASAAYQIGDMVVADAESEMIVGEDHLVKLRKDDNFIIIMTLVTRRADEIVFNSITELHGRTIVNQDDILFIHPVVSVAKAWNTKSM